MRVEKINCLNNIEGKPYKDVKTATIALNVEEIDIILALLDAELGTECSQKDLKLLYLQREFTLLSDLVQTGNIDSYTVSRLAEIQNKINGLINSTKE